MLRSFSLFLSVLAVLMIGTANVQAQGAFGGDENGAFAPAKFGENNSQLKAILDLQYQLQLLKRMIEREKSVSSMVSSALEIGVTNPYIPAPDRTLCLQVPANIACALAYKGMYPDYSVETQTPPAAPPTAASNDMVGIPAMASKELPPLPLSDLKIPEHGTLYWSAVTCMHLTCSAVITPTPGDPRARYQVLIGDKLADGAVVSEISAAGVTLQHHDKPVMLEPAPKA